MRISWKYNVKILYVFGKHASRVIWAAVALCVVCCNLDQRLDVWRYWALCAKIEVFAFEVALLVYGGSQWFGSRVCFRVPGCFFSIQDVVIAIYCSKIWTRNHSCLLVWPLYASSFFFFNQPLVDSFALLTALAFMYVTGDALQEDAKSAASKFVVWCHLCKLCKHSRHIALVSAKLFLGDEKPNENLYYSSFDWYHTSKKIGES